VHHFYVVPNIEITSDIVKLGKYVLLFALLSVISSICGAQLAFAQTHDDSKKKSIQFKHVKKSILI